MRRISLVWFVALALAASLVATVATPVRAATINVTTTDDEMNTDGDCSLREAIAAATNNAGFDACAAGEATPDTITVPAGTYLIASVLLVGDVLIDQEITIAGAGAATTIIDGGDATRVFSILGGDVTLSGLTIRRGLSTGGGGIAVDPDVNLDLTDVIVTDNHVVDGVGGGIFVQIGGDLDVTGSTISANSATFGGGIYMNDESDLTVTSSTVTGNSARLGGGIYNDRAIVSVQGTPLTGNTATGDDISEARGGGIYNSPFSQLTLTGSTLSGNVASRAAPFNDGDGGAIYNDDAATTVTDSTIGPNNSAGDDGGAIYNNESFDGSASVTLTRSTLNGNDAGDDGGAIFNTGTLQLVNSTLSGNSAGDDGGALFNFSANSSTSTASLINSTVTANATAGGASNLGGGIFNLEGGNQGGGQVTLSNSIVADQVAGADCATNAPPAPGPAATSAGSNLDSDGTCLAVPAAGDIPSGDANLGPLANNGGPTMTHALLFDSDAVDEGNDVVCLGPPVGGMDQRGATVGPRPADGDGDGTPVCDIGAFELQPPSASINDVMVTEGNSGTVAATFTVTLSRASTGTVSYAWSTANGTAVAPGDYQTASGTVTFAPGDTSETLTVNVVGDTVDEPNETFTVTLGTPVGGTIADGTGTGTILDDDAGPVVTPSPTAGQLPDTATIGGEAASGFAAIPTAITFLASATALAAVRRRTP